MIYPSTDWYVANISCCFYEKILNHQLLHIVSCVYTRVICTDLYSHNKWRSLPSNSTILPVPAVMELRGWLWKFLKSAKSILFITPFWHGDWIYEGYLSFKNTRVLNLMQSISLCILGVSQSLCVGLNFFDRLPFLVLVCIGHVVFFWQYSYNKESYQSVTYLPIQDQR